MTAVYNLAKTFPMVSGTIISCCINAFRIAYAINNNKTVFLSEERRTLIKSIIDELAKKLEINTPIELVENETMGFGAAIGGNTFYGKVIICVNKEFNVCSVAEIEAMMSHELSHLKANDSLIRPKLWVIGGIVGKILNIFFSSNNIPIKTALIINFVIPLIMQWREKCADQSGFSVCSNAGKQAMINHFYEHMRNNIKYRNDKNVSYFSSLWRKCEVAEDGTYRKDILHPALKERVRYLSEELRKLGPNLNEETLAQFHKGKRLFERRSKDKNDIARAEECFSKAAKQGHIGAQYYLGMMYRYGHIGCKSDNGRTSYDHETAREYLNKAALAGYREAQDLLDQMPS